ncbi:MAG: FG-GAP repeat domain-containing protein [Anaerolineae bacterium]
MDNDNNLEIVVTTGGIQGPSSGGGTHRNGGVLVYKYTSPWSFSVVSDWPQPKLDIIGSGSGASNPDGCWDGVFGSPALGDLDGDNDLEVVVEGLDRRIHAWHHNGQAVDGWPLDSTNLGISRGGWSSPALADIDEDGLPEVIVGSDAFPAGGQPPYLFFALNGDGSVLPGFPIETPQNTQSSPAIGDINNDGDLDIVVGTGTFLSSGGNMVFAWDKDGNALPGWPQTTEGKMPSSPALGDLDGDGDLEVVIGCGAEGDGFNPAPCTKLYAWHGDGSAVSGFPMTPENNTGWPAAANGLPYTPILADYDGDNSVEILVLNRWSWGLSTVETNGQSNNDATFVTAGPMSSSPLVDDVDNDGKLEIVIGGGPEGGNGVVYIWDVNGDAGDASPWPMFHQNVARTGQVPNPPKLTTLSNISILHQGGSMMLPAATGHLRLTNEGGGSFDWTITHAISALQSPTNDASGTAEEAATIPLTIDATGLGSGTNNLGNITVSARSNGDHIEGSPQTIKLFVYVGDISKVYVPLILR